MFIENVELDARLVLASMKGGMDAIINYAFACKSFSTPNDAVKRCIWLKKQKPLYLKAVSDKVVELEK